MIKKNILLVFSLLQILERVFQTRNRITTTKILNNKP